MTKDRKITYPQVLKMTNNFERVLGKGGFGTVYHGNMEDAQVAVKMLSHSSAQGYKEFKAEVLKQEVDPLVLFFFLNIKFLIFLSFLLG